MAESPTAPTAPAGSRLRPDAIGTGSLVFLVLAAAAPLAGFIFNVPLVIGFGAGVGAPGIFVVTTLALFCFAVGYAAMSAHMSNAGAFYAYIARGFGTRLGLSGAYVAVFAYTAILVAICGVFSWFANSIFISEFSIDLPWQAWAGILVLVLAALAYRRVDFNARLLSLIFTLEIALVLVLDVAILVDQGLSAFTLESLNPSVVFGNAPGVALTFSFATFIGFEATAIFAEETKNPKKTVPRATYMAVILVGSFFAIGSWALIAGAGAGEAAAVAAEDPGSFVFTQMETYVGSFALHVTNILLLTSLFGTALGLHNAGARYLFALARDGVMPAPLARTHRAHGSPWIASVTQLCFIAVVIVVFALAGADPLLVMGTSLVGVGTLGILSLQAAVGFAVIAFFWRHPERHWWRTVLAPLLGSAALTAAIVLIIDNYELVGHTTSDLLNHAPWLLLAIAVGGAVYASWLRSADPDKFAAVGGALVSDTIDPDFDAITELEAETAG